MNDEGELTETIQRLRADKYDDLPSDLVDAILVIEAALIEDQVEATKRVAQIVEEHLQQEKE